MLYLIIFSFIFSVVLSFHKNSEIFTPSKFYFLFLFLYFFDIFVSPQIFAVYIIYLVYIFLGIILILIEQKLIGNFKFHIDILRNLKKPTLLNPNPIFISLLFLTLIPLLSQLYMISLAGGLQAYFISMKLRVISWSGLGYIYIFRDFLPIINLFFFIVLLMFKFKSKKFWAIIYIFHLILTLAIGAMSGSRSAILNTIVFNIVAFHFIIKEVKKRSIIFFSILLLLFSTILYNARQQVSFDDGSLNFLNKDFSLVDSLKEKTTSIYGIIPLIIIYEKEYKNFNYGSTYLTTITNYIPKFIWPSKPSSSGVLLTKFYYGGLYEGSTNFSTGFITEGIMNFGYVLGPFIGSFFFITICCFVLIFYRSLKRDLIKQANNLDYILDLKRTMRLIFFIIILVQIPASSTIAESNNIGFNFIKQLVFYLFIEFFVYRLIHFKYKF